MANPWLDRRRNDRHLATGAVYANPQFRCSCRHRFVRGFCRAWPVRRRFGDVFSHSLVDDRDGGAQPDESLIGKYAFVCGHESVLHMAVILLVADVIWISADVTSHAKLDQT